MSNMKINLGGPNPLESLSYAELQAIHREAVFLDYHELKQIVDVAVLQEIHSREKTNLRFTTCCSNRVSLTGTSATSCPQEGW